ncbi:MAG: DinB family protein [Anaerolineae bacterium]|nr:DinB family protein [Anaerolineae bacterium]
MKIEEIKLLYEYTYWADQRILATCANVTEEQYTAPFTYHSLRGALVHKLDSDCSWRTAFQTYFVPRAALPDAPPATAWNIPELTEADLPTLSILKERWQVEERAMRTYLDTLTDEDLYGYVRYLIPAGIVRERVLWHCLVHVVNHGTQHRSEAAEMLTRYGYSPGELDMTVFMNEYFNFQRE